jgi:hypothetical protein
MHKEPAARITRRTVSQLETLAETVTPLSYNVQDYAKLGLLYRLLHVSKPAAPSQRRSLWYATRSARLLQMHAKSRSIFAAGLNLKARALLAKPLDWYALG